MIGNTGDIKYISILEKYLISENQTYAKTAEDSIKRIKASIDS